MPEATPAAVIDPVFASFESWTKQYAAASAVKKAELEPEGISLAAQRRDSLLSLMKSDPQRALERSTSYADRSVLPASIQSKLEVPIHSKGTLGVVVSLHFDNTQHRHNVATIDGEIYTAHVFGRRSNQIAKTPVPLHGIAIGHDVALSENPVRLLDADEAAVVLATKTGKRYCPVSGREVSGDDAAVAQSGGEYVYLCHSNHLNDLNQQIIAQEGGAAGTLDAPIAQSAWTTGNKTVLYIIVRFTDQAAEPQTFSDATTEMNTVSAWFNEVSFGLTSMTPTITPCFVMPQDTAYYVTNGDGVLMSDARAVAKANGFDYATYSLDTIRWNGGPGSYGGQAYVGSRGCWLKSSSAGVAEHELGHNYGLWHSNYWNAPNDTVIGPGNNVEYGDPYDVMGAAGGGAQHYNAYEKNRLDWIPAANVNTVTTGGTYRLYSFDSTFDSANMYALKTKKDATRDYWVDFRQKFTSNIWEMSGIELRWNPYSTSTGSLLLDTTPSSPDGMNDAAVVIGRTFSDYISDIHFTPTAKGGTTPESIDVVINRGTWANDRPPVISISASTTTVATNTTVGFTATASDPDGDTLAYYWDFGDRTFGPNSSTASKSWSSARDYVVRCTVSDMKGGTASAMIVVSVGAPVIRRITGTVHDSLGNPLADVLVNNGLTATDSNYRYCYTTSDGAYSLVSVAATAYTINATKPGWTFTHAFTNPITGPATGIDFTGAENLYKITGKVTTDGTNGLAPALVSNGTVTEPTDASGNFTLQNIRNGSYTLTATKPGFTLSPYNFTNPVSVEFADATGKTFSTGTTYVVSGEITGVPAGTAVTVTDGYRTTTSFKSGNGASAKTLYNLVGVPAGTWTLRASMTGTSFSPNGWTNPVTVSGTTTGKNFVADGAQSFAISGTITDLGTGLSGVTVSAGGKSGVSDNNGAYFIAGLANGTYTATPAKSGFTFTPTNLSVTLSGANVTGQNFATTNVDMPPTVATAASATPNPIFDFKTSLSVLGADNAGEAYLTYTWSALGTPPGPVTYSVNGAHAAKTALATFTVPGTYTLRATIRDFNGGTVTSDVSVNVIDPAGLPIVAFNAPSSSGLESVTSVSLPVSLSMVFSDTVTVNYAVSGGSATGGGVDYTFTAGTLTFNPGDMTQNISFSVVNDALDESNETIQITLSSATNAVIGGNSSHTYTITDDDPSPTVAFNATSSNGSESTTAVSLPVSLSTASGQIVTVNYAVTGGTASGSGSDFTLAAGTLTFAPGTTTKNIALTVVNDALNETNETIQVTLSAPVNATLGANTVHTYTINDNDPAPSVGFSAASSSGLESITAVNIPVALSAASGQSVSVSYAVTGGTASGGGVDYTLAAGTLTFAPGTTTKNIAVTVNNETLAETSETIVITLSTPVNATLGTSTHTYTILNDDNTPPVAANATFNTLKNTLLSGMLTATDANNDPVTFALASNGTLGTAIITNGSTGAFTYSPKTGARGTDTFTFKANDGYVDSNVATITVNINNGKPVASASSLTALLSKPASGTLTANDPDGDALTFTALNDATLGTFTLDPATGEFTYTAQNSAGGQDTITFQVSDGQDTSAPSTLIITIPAPITFGSGGVIPTMITVGVPTVFNSGAGSGLDIVWDFGDGSTAKGDPAIHTYQAAGNYTLRVTASDTNGQSESKEFPLSVVDGGDSQTLVDTDGDGVSDANEISMGTNPLDAASVMKLPMTVSKIAGSTRVGSTGKDSCQISGSLPGIGALKSLKDMTFRFNIGGADVLFTLDAMGRGKNAHGTLSLKLKPGKKNTKTRAIEFLGGPLSYKAKVSGDFAAGWFTAGLDTTKSAKNAPLSLPVDIYFNGSIYTAQVNTLFSAIAGKSGKFKK